MSLRRSKPTPDGTAGADFTPAPANLQHNMTNTDQPDVKFEGEEAGSGIASPTLDLIASAVLVAISLVIMAASVARAPLIVKLNAPRAQRRANGRGRMPPAGVFREQ